MSIGLDTSVVVRLLVGEPRPAAAKAKDRLLEAHQRRQLVVVSDVVLAEAYHALKFHYDIEPAAIRTAMRAMLTSGLVVPEPGSAALAVLTEKAAGKAGFVDRLIQARYEADNRLTWTMDKAQGKLGLATFIG